MLELLGRSERSRVVSDDLCGWVKYLEGVVFFAVEDNIFAKLTYDVVQHIKFELESIG